MQLQKSREKHQKIPSLPKKSLNSVRNTDEINNNTSVFKVLAA